MSSVNDWHRVLWHEGMYLLPQQFQQWDRNQQRQLLRMGEGLAPFPWGFTALEVDQEALQGGNLRLGRCAGVLPDGFVFDLPAGGDLPPGRSLPDGADSCRVALALPERRNDGPLWSDSGVESGEPTRFRRREMPLLDGSPEGLEDPVALAIPQLRLLFDEEAESGHSSLLVGNFKRDAGGSWSLLAGSCPPLLHIAAWEPLLSAVSGLRDFLRTRSAELVGQRRERTSGAVEFSVSEINQLLKAMAVSRCLPLLDDALSHGRAHPHEIHRLLASLAGEVAIFGEASALPTYRHNEALSGILALQESLRGLLGFSAPTRYVPLSLQRVNDRIAKAEVPEGLCEEAVFYLDLASALPASQLMTQVPAAFKLTSAGRIGSLVAKALRGVELSYLSVPPSEIPARPDHHYFELQPTGPEWEEIRNANSIAVYTPPDLGEIGLELLAVRR